MQRQITTEQIIDEAVTTLKASLYIRWGGTVVAFNAAAMTVDVQPNPSDPRRDLDTDAVVPEPWQVIKGVPIAWMRFGGFVLAGPMSVGDPCILEAFDVDPTTWMAQGRSLSPVDPADVDRLAGAYWTARPADLSGPAQDAAAAALALILGVDGDQAQLRIKAGSLQLGATGGDFVALASKVDACMAAIKGHTHPVPGVRTGSDSTTSSASDALSSLPLTGSALIGAQ